MSRKFLLTAFVFCQALQAAEPIFQDFDQKPLNGTYSMYGGTLGEPKAPTNKDAKIAFIIEGKAAMDIFNAIGPDAKNGCSTEAGYRERNKDGGRLSCTKTKDGEYNCYWGFDLKTGKSIGGAIC